MSTVATRFVWSWLNALPLSHYRLFGYATNVCARFRPRATRPRITGVYVIVKSWNIETPLRNRTPIVESANLRWREFFFEFHRARETHDKRVIGAMCNERDFLLCLRDSRVTSHRLLLSRVFVVSGEKNAPHRETKKKKEGRTRQRSTFAAGSVKSFGVARSCLLVLLVIDSPSRCASGRCTHSNPYVYVLHPFRDILTRRESRMWVTIARRDLRGGRERDAHMTLVRNAIMGRSVLWQARTCAYAHACAVPCAREARIR